MSLPNNDLPQYELNVPSTGKSITVRPFTVKEEKLLLIASESKDENEIINTTKQIVKNCILSEDIDVNNIPFFDMDYIFIALRAKSVGESIKIKFRCNHNVYNNDQGIPMDGDYGNPCDNNFDANIDIKDCKVEMNDQNPEIHLGSGMMVKMKYPTYAVMKSTGAIEDNLSRKIKIIAASIDYVIKADKTYTAKDFTRQEIIDFVEGLIQEQFKKLEVWVDNFPTFAVHTTTVCPKCNFEHKITYTDFSAFFL